MTDYSLFLAVLVIVGPPMALYQIERWLWSEEALSAYIMKEVGDD